MELVTATTFREGMAHLAGAVSIIATDGAAGKGGLTATAVTSVSDSPPTLLVCVNTSSTINALIKANQHFSVNLLGEGHESLSNRFAGMVKGISAEERFLEGDWEKSIQTDIPMLADSLASFECRLSHLQEVGTHTVFFGEVVSVNTHGTKRPLIYFDRGYKTI